MRGSLVQSDRIRALLGLASAALLAASLSACAGAAATQTAKPSATPSVLQTETATPTPIATPIPTPSLPPAFIATGSMNGARVYAAAIRLDDGRVLIAGGSPELPTLAGPPILRTAELYDPGTGKFTTTGSMNVARSQAAAARLPDGRILIVGGHGCPTTKNCSTGDTTGGGPITSAELYDPSSGKFAKTGSMSKARSGASAMALSDGRILVVGPGETLVEVYDPAAGAFSSAGSLLRMYATLAAVALPSGKILVVGPALGGPSAGGASAEVFDPATGNSTAISIELPEGAATAAANGGYTSAPESATLLRDGRVLLCIFDYLVIYDPAAGSFTQSGAISAPAEWLAFSTTLLPDGRVLFAGGESSDNESGAGVPASRAGMFDPASGYQPIHAMTRARSGHTMTLLADGTVLVAGGGGPGELATKSAELLRT